MCTVKDRIKGKDENNGFQTLVKPATWETDLASLLQLISSLEAFRKKLLISVKSSFPFLSELILYV